MKQKTLHYLWVTLPCSILLAAVLCIVYVCVPAGKLCLLDSQQLYRHIVKKREASTSPEKENYLNSEIMLIDSLLRQIDKRTLLADGELVDVLYRYADSARFVPEKVETGIPQPADGHYETSISIRGRGSYVATGKLVEMIENSSQSTRIRQLTMKTGEQEGIEVFIDVAVSEELDTAETR